AVAAPARADRPYRAGRAACARLRAAVRRPVSAGAAGADLAVRPDAAARGTPAGPARARRPPRRPSLPAAPLPRAVDQGRRGVARLAAGHAPRRGSDGRTARQPPAGLLGP